MAPSQKASPLAQMIIDRLDSIDDNVRSMDNKVDRVDSAVERVNGRVEKTNERINNISDALGGQDGIRERLTALETRIETWENTPPSAITITSKAAKKSTKEHADALGTTGGVVGVVYGVLELAKMWLSSTAK